MTTIKNNKENNTITYSPIKNRLIARNEQRRNEVNSFVKQQNQKLHQQVQSAKDKADKVYTATNKANQRAAKKYGYLSNVAQLQKQLYDEGYYDEGTTIEQAIDGIMGPKTKQALERKKIADNIKNNNYPTSNNINEQAIIDHKVHSNVEDPYWIFDKKTSQLKHMKGDKILAQFQTMSGLSSDQDGYNFYNSHNKKSGKSYYDLQKQAMVTPSGIFTLHPSSYEGTPSFRFVEGKRGNEHKNRNLSAMLHKMPEMRVNDYNNGIYHKSYGCINLPNETLNYMVKNNASGDSLYVLPVKEGNYIYESEEEGHPLKIQYANAPNIVNGKHYGQEYTLPLEYNRGY